jgi:hypothetical protein
VLAVLAGRDRAERERLLAAHCEAVCRIVGAAADAQLADDRPRARKLASHASKLCGELAGLWPAGSDQPLS